MLLAIDLFAGLGGWAEGFLAEGYEVIGFDIERRPYAGQLVIQDVRTLQGRQFRNATVIVASPPCQEYSYRAMPWKRAKALPPPSNELFEACFRIQREASEAAGRHVPMIVENVCGAQKWVGRAKWHYGSYYLWGDVPALMPFGGRKKAVDSSYGTGGWFGPHGGTNVIQDGNGNYGVKIGSDWFRDPNWGMLSSRSNARKLASALIAKIPFPLARHIATVFKNVSSASTADPCLKTTPELEGLGSAS